MRARGIGDRAPRPHVAGTAVQDEERPGPTFDGYDVVTDPVIDSCAPASAILTGA